MEKDSLVDLETVALEELKRVFVVSSCWSVIPKRETIYSTHRHIQQVYFQLLSTNVCFAPQNGHQLVLKFQEYCVIFLNLQGHTCSRRIQGDLGHLWIPTHNVLAPFSQEKFQCLWNIYGEKPSGLH